MTRLLLTGSYWWSSFWGRNHFTRDLIGWGTWVRALPIEVVDGWRKIIPRRKWTVLLDSGLVVLAASTVHTGSSFMVRPRMRAAIDYSSGRYLPHRIDISIDLVSMNRKLNTLEIRIQFQAYIFLNKCNIFFFYIFSNIFLEYYYGENNMTDISYDDASTLLSAGLNCVADESIPCDQFIDFTWKITSVPCERHIWSKY